MILGLGLNFCYITLLVLLNNVYKFWARSLVLVFDFKILTKIELSPKGAETKFCSKSQRRQQDCKKNILAACHGM